jgi:transposase-like protein
MEEDMKKKERQESKPQYHDRADVLEEYARRIRNGEKVGMAELLESMVSDIMKLERDLYLQQVQGESANGFYSRTLQLSIGKLDLKVPRVRNGKEFRPALLPPKWKRVDKDYENLLTALLTNGCSQSQMERALHSLGLPYSPERIDELLEEIRQRMEVYRTSQLPADQFVVMIDAYRAVLRVDGGKVRDISIFTAQGIDHDGRKSILGYWVLEGSESKAFWADVFQDMVSRGLKKVQLFVTDDFPGVREIISKLYPFSDHQLCYVHMQRNLMRRLSKKVYAAVRKHVYLAKESQTMEDGLKHFEDACATIALTDREYATRLRERAENYLAFLRYPEAVRKHVYTTNSVESINSGLEYMRRELGGYFPSRQALDVNYFIQIENKNESWMRKPVPAIHSASYELRQLHAIKFELKEDEVAMV